MSKYEFSGFVCGDSAYTSLSDYRRWECRDGWRQFHSMQASYKVVGSYVYFKSYDYVACVYNRNTQTLYVDSACLNKSRTTNRQLSRFLSEWVHEYMGLRYIQDAINEYHDETSDYAIDGLYMANIYSMTYINIVVVEGLY